MKNNLIFKVHKIGSRNKSLFNLSLSNIINLATSSFSLH